MLTFTVVFFLTQAEENDDDDDDVPRVENVVARQLLGSSHHLFSANDTNVVGGLQVFRSRVWVSDQKEKQEKKLAWSYIYSLFC